MLHSFMLPRFANFPSLKGTAKRDSHSLYLFVPDVDLPFCLLIYFLLKMWKVAKDFRAKNP